MLHANRGEQKALRAGRIDESDWLAGQFHVLLTELAGGAQLHELTARLVAKTELYKVLFDPSKGSAFSRDEDARIIAALEPDDSHAALGTMREYLAELDERVIEQLRREAGRDPRAVFSR